ncbi:MAG: hypothetical protein R3F61_22030 [Myxococcota bacterium]
MEWRVPVIGGVVLGVMVVIWQLVSAAIGATALFPLVATLLELIVVIGAMAQTRQVHGYGQQVAAGVTIAALACVFIVPGAVAVGATTADIAAGGIGTLVTGVVVALLAAIPLRRRDG